MGHLVRASIENSLWVTRHIQKIADDIGDPELTRDVIEACRTEQAFLFLAGNGFIVLKPKVDDGVKRVLIWVGWRPDRSTNYFIQDIEQLGRLIDAEEIEFWTKRKGFHRLSEKLGFDLHEIKDGFFIWRRSLWAKAVTSQANQLKKEN